MPSTFSNPRIVLCEACGSEGRIYHNTYRTDEYGCEILREEPCEACDGTGGEIIETQPIELDDLDEMCGEAQPPHNGYCPCGNDEPSMSWPCTHGHCGWQESCPCPACEEWRKTIKTEIERLIPRAESGEQWAHICLLEARLVQQMEGDGR